ncbi:hypothetical protein [Skermania sp. ID1734]|uniref:hypothetical protein n=1 Tax=Skermania sp. ID1734 TaxID=2597516 RepID=UPI002103B0BF|nr:hypothetical protein [Skermania sp. ID1734]
MQRRRVLMAGCCVSAALWAGACSSTTQQVLPSTTAEPTAQSAAQAVAPAQIPPIPTAAQLDATLKSALNPGLPDDARVALIQDGEAFRSSIPDLYKAMHDNPNAKYWVVDPVFDNHDGTITATFKLDKDGTGTAIRTATVHFIAIDGKWKIARTDLCGILRSANYRTAACG